MKFLLRSNKDFICSKRYFYSLERLLLRYPNGVPDRIAAAALAISEDELNEEYERIVEKLRVLMKIECI